MIWQSGLRTACNSPECPPRSPPHPDETWLRQNDIGPRWSRVRTQPDECRAIMAAIETRSHNVGLQSRAVPKFRTQAEAKITSIGIHKAGGDATIVPVAVNKPKTGGP